MDDPEDNDSKSGRKNPEILDGSSLRKDSKNDRDSKKLSDFKERKDSKQIRDSGNNWTGLLNKNFRPTPPFSGRDIILVSDTEILEVLKRLLRTHGWAHVLNQLAWWFVQAYAVVASDDAFVVKYGGKASANAMKPLFCEIEVEEAYTLPLLVDHVSSNYNSSDRTAINVLLESVIMAAITKIGECDWMDNRSRKAAVDKLREIFINLWPREDIYAEFFPPSAERQKQKSYVRYWIRDHELSASEIGAAIYYEKNRMAHNFRDETFEYDYLLNNVSLPMLALEDPFYDRRGSAAFNYGALGSVFARKVVMSFDPQGINHLPNGTLHSWLSKDSKATFMQKATCGVEDFQPNIFPEIPGLEVTFRAFQDASRSSQRSSEDHPSVEDKKMFFLAFCHVMCILDAKEIGERCNVVLKHFRPFAETFECPLGSSMNPTHKCRFF
ncbi:endothelin-converting enzyme 1-like [Ixodes scapularis]